MNPFDSPTDATNHRGAHCLVNCHVFATREHVRALEGLLPDEHAASVTLHEIAPQEPVLPEALRQAQCLILEVDPRDQSSLARMEQVRRARPSMPIIAAIQNADFNLTRVLVRQGVFDVVSLPFDVEEVMSRLMDASATFAANSAVALAPMVSVVGSAAAVGATTVVTHLAAALADAGVRRCCIVDLDLQFGQIADYYGIEPPTSVLELLEAGERLDGDLLRNAAVDTGRGPFVISAPTTIHPLEQVDVDGLLRLLDIARREFDFVLLDLPANWTNWTLSAVAASSEVLLVTGQSLSALRHAKRCIELFDSVEIPESCTSVVVNRFEKRLLQKIGADDVERALKRPVRATLAVEKGGLSEAQDRGLLLPEVARRARFSADIAELAGELTGALK